MIKFFRKIRQKLLKENRVSKYLIYAFGEIILVVIGILIALQINNWNSNQINKQKEALLLEELHNEFVKNREQFEHVIKMHEKALRSNESVIALFPINPKTINLDSLEKTREGWVLRYTFNPSQGVVKSLVNSSSFELISNKVLRKLLISWEDVLADYQEEEIYASTTLKESLLPIVLENIPLANVKDPRFDTSFLATFQFENIHKLRRFHLLNILDNKDGELDAIRHTINQIIALSKPVHDD